jgi:hypothetical protein
MNIRREGNRYIRINIKLRSDVSYLRDENKQLGVTLITLQKTLVQQGCQYK